jgi:hypothetical protein
VRHRGSASGSHTENAGRSGAARPPDGRAAPGLHIARDVGPPAVSSLCADGGCWTARATSRFPHGRSTDSAHRVRCSPSPL